MKSPSRGKKGFIASRLHHLLIAAFLTAATAAWATPPAPGTPPDWLDYWQFSDTNTWHSDLGYAPLTFSNLDASLLGHVTAVVVDNTNAALLRYNVTEASGATNLTVGQGSVMFWFAASWSGTNAGGTGPGSWGRLIEVGAYTTNASYGWWSVYTDPAGVNLYFAAQTNDGSQALYVSSPINWTTNRWHLIALTYSATNSALYLDGQLAAEGYGVSYQPGPNVLSNGFYLGSDSGGNTQARGMFDDLSTYNFPLSATRVAANYLFTSIYYYGNPSNAANFNPAPATASYGPVFNAITGSGYLSNPVTNATGCLTSSNVWMTNVVATGVAGGGMNLTFTIAGGTNGVLYDVFANSLCAPASDTNHPWAWMGQGYHCTTYTLTNLPSWTAFLILGTPQDTDGDGLTDAYEYLASKTNPNNPDTDGDGMWDGWEVMWGLNPKNSDESAQSSSRMNYQYDAAGWLRVVSGVLSGAVSLDGEGNVLEVSQ